MLYSGVITKGSPYGYRIKESRIDKTYSLTFANQTVENMFGKLKINDFVTFEGARSSATNTIRVESVNYVGLTDLIGVWQGDDNYCYNFNSFTELWIYFRTGPGCGHQTFESRIYAYTVNPSDPDWIILLSDNQSSYIADLVVEDEKSINISLYDSNSGNILRHIKLKK